jgi:basic membrane protein A and related proteins
MVLRRNQGAATRVSLLAVLILLVLVPAVAACAPQPTDCAQEDVFCVGLVTAFEGVNNHGLNQAAWESLQNVEAQAHIARLDKIESVDARDWQKNIVFFAENHYDVIVTVGANLDDATVAVAADYPDILFIGVDQQFMEETEEYKNIAMIRFPRDQAGFLAGVLAALVSSSGKVGAICEASGIAIVWQYCEGFRSGVLYEDKDVEALVVYRDSGDRNKTFNDPEWGQQAILRMVKNGVDAMTGFGGGTAEGAFLAASNNGVLVIGSEEDLYYQLPGLQPRLVSSIIKDPGPVLSFLVLLASRGEPVSGQHTGQVTYAPFRISLFKSKTEIESSMKAALQGIKNGEIEIDLPDPK